MDDYVLSQRLYFMTISLQRKGVKEENKGGIKKEMNKRKELEK